MRSQSHGKKCVRTPSYVHSVQTSLIRVDAKKRSTTGWFLLYVHTSNAISRIAKLRQEKRGQEPVTNEKEDVICTGRVDIDRLPRVPSGKNLCPVKIAPTGRTGHVSGEVTL